MPITASSSRTNPTHRLERGREGEWIIYRAVVGSTLGVSLHHATGVCLRVCRREWLIMQEVNNNKENSVDDSLFSSLKESLDHIPLTTTRKSKVEQIFPNFFTQDAREGAIPPTRSENDVGLFSTVTTKKPMPWFQNNFFIRGVCNFLYSISFLYSNP